LVASLVRGVLSSSFGWLFNRVDENLISPSPMAPHALYIAKKFKRFVIHIMGVAVLLVAIFPFISRIGFTGFQLALLFVSLLAMVEFYGLTENISHCLSRALVARGRRSRLLGLTGLIVVLSFIVFIPLLSTLGVNLGPINSLFYFYPPYTISRIFILNTKIIGFGFLFPITVITLNNSFEVMASETISILCATIVFAFIAASSAGFGLKRWSSSPRLSQTRGRFLQLRKSELRWKPGSKNDVNLILKKDFWVTIRNPAKFLIPLAITLILMGFSLELQSMFSFPQLQVSSTAYTEPIFLLSSYLAAVFVLPPAWDSFASERRTVYLLKTAPIIPSNIVKGKYLFALIKSFSYVAPIVIAFSFILPHTLNISIVLLEVILILMVSNAVGVLASVSYPPAYRGVGPPPFLIVVGLPLLSALLTAIIPLSFMTYFVDPTLFAVASIGMVLYSFMVLSLCVGRAAKSFNSLQEI
jgi:hypothetical protein